VLPAPADPLPPPGAVVFGAQAGRLERGLAVSSRRPLRL